MVLVSLFLESKLYSIKKSKFSFLETQNNNLQSQDPALGHSLNQAKQ